MAKENRLLLTLPNVTLICGNESDEAGGDVVEETETEVTGKNRLGQHDPVVDQDIEYSSVGGSGSRDKEQFSCHQHQPITSTLKSERSELELQDLYKLLMQLPNFSHTTWSGFGSSALSTTRIKSPPTKTTGKKRKIFNAREEGKVGKHVSIQNTDFFQDDKECLETETGDQSSLRNREVVKLHSINLYQSILPPSLFSNMNHRRKLT